MSGRRKQHSQRKTFEPTHLWNGHQEMLRLASLGMKEVEIAAILGFTPAAVSYTLNSQLGEKRLEDLHAKRNEETVDVIAAMKKMVPQAVEIYNQILTAESASLGLKMKAADQVLSRAGFPVPKQIQVEGTVKHLTSEDMERIRKRGEELRNQILDGEFTLVMKDDETKKSTALVCAEA